MKTSKTSNRIQFNHGYHDGALATRRGWRQPWQTGSHFSKAYEAGYHRGVNDQRDGVYIDGKTLSDAAWKAALEAREVSR